jgi:hypothetical protein
MSPVFQALQTLFEFVTTVYQIIKPIVLLFLSILILISLNYLSGQQKQIISEQSIKCCPLFIGCLAEMMTKYPRLI